MKRLFDAVLVAVLALSVAAPAAFAGPGKHKRNSPKLPRRIRLSRRNRHSPSLPPRIRPNSHERRINSSRLHLTKIRRRRASNPVRKKTSTPSGIGVWERA